MQVGTFIILIYQIVQPSVSKLQMNNFTYKIVALDVIRYNKTTWFHFLSKQKVYLRKCKKRCARDYNVDIYRSELRIRAKYKLIQMKMRHICFFHRHYNSLQIWIDLYILIRNYDLNICCDFRLLYAGVLMPNMTVTMTAKLILCTRD